VAAQRLQHGEVLRGLPQHEARRLRAREGLTHRGHGRAVQEAQRVSEAEL
jgi:hypothetical protein